jgi:glycosyltransferase involved in cell wall biosynthesis
MAKHRPRILLCAVNIQSFVQRDIEAIATEYPVVVGMCNSLWSTLKTIARVPSSDCIVCWFGSIRFLPVVFLGRVLRKKILIILGGYDVANVPEIHYGEMHSFIRRYLVRIVIAMAHRVACVSRSNAEEAVRNAKVSPGKITIIYHGFDPGQFADIDTNSKERLVLTVGRINTSNLYRKGLMTFVKVAHWLPDVRFVVAGPYDNDALETLKNIAGDNVTFMGYVSKEDLDCLYARAKVYLQPSIHEAFGCSVAEAMLYNCIPVVSNRFALPEVVGDAGIYVEPGDIEGIASALRRALDGDIQLPENPRERILREFPMSKRRALLIEMIKELCS